jgi:ABC-type polysaccharide/polyol phosphate transport system ATPase subunit
VSQEDFWALKDISFEIRQGDVLGIIGRNGAGKSTLLKILSRITEPTVGRVRIRGRVASMLEVGTGFHPELTGRENIYLNGAILGMGRLEIRSKFDEIVAFAEVEKFLDTPVKRYSSGMYVRLAFAVAAHLEPEILVIDEVLAVGDAQFQKKCLGKLNDVGKGGRTVVFVSHNMAAVQSLCGSGMFLESGQLRRLGPIGSVIGEYNTSLLKNRTLDAKTSINLGATLKLERLDLEPTTIRSGGSLSMHIRIMPKRQTMIMEMAILIYSADGVRVAILDLRQEGIRDLILWNDPLSFEVFVPDLRLVEGDYRLGLFMATQYDQADFLDLLAFTVGAPDLDGDIAPYPAKYRGFLELEYSVRAPTVILPDKILM